MIPAAKSMFRYRGVVASLTLLLVTLSPAVAQAETNVFESTDVPAPASQLDELIFAQWARLSFHPVLCSDAVFLRRAYLDVIGTLPTAQEAREFIQDSHTNKRSALIDRLLQRDEFADYWAMKWGDILRIKAEFPINLWPNAAQAYHRWVRSSIAENKPYDQFAREMLTASGSNFRVGPVNFYRAIQNRTPEGIAGAVALTFMGTRMETWPPERAAGMTAFFSQIGYKPTSEWKEEHVFWDPLGICTLPGSSAPGRPAIIAIASASASNAVVQSSFASRTNAQRFVFPDGSAIEAPPNRDLREAFADWLIDSKNPWFTRAIVNRVWAWLLGRGIIHEPDDIRDDNLPSDPALLAYLEHEFVSARYDLKQIYRLILNSIAYQVSALPRSNSADAETHFASYPLRRLDAEVLIDAINRITGTSDLYTSPIPEPFTFIPGNQTAIAIADGSITSPFLALFGRSPRATGMHDERNNEPVPAQRLHLLNSSHIQRKLDQGPKLPALFDSRRNAPEILDELYLTILSRLPTPQEVETAIGYRNPSAVGIADKTGRTKGRDEWADIAWSLINSTEFLYRH
jgi:hypothetical protein